MYAIIRNTYNTRNTLFPSHGPRKRNSKLKSNSLDLRKQGLQSLKNQVELLLLT